MLDANAVTPLYQQLVDKLKGEILSGVYKSGDKLLPEQEMAKQNNVSVITARKAMNELVAIGLVEKKQGKGTFVAYPKYDRDYTQIQGFGESCRLRGLRPGSKLLDKKLVAPGNKICKRLEIAENSQTVMISRLRYVNEQPMAIETNYFSLNYAFLLNESLEDSLFEVLKSKAGIEVEKSRKVVEICRASAQEAELLNLKLYTPLLLVRSTAYTFDGTPVYVCFQQINGERFKLIL